MRKTARNYAIVGWMAFLMAIAAEGLFFSVFDPIALAQVAGREWGALDAYSIGFFCFWGCFAASGLLALRLTQAVREGRPRRYA